MCFISKSFTQFLFLTWSLF